MIEVELIEGTVESVDGVTYHVRPRAEFAAGILHRFSEWLDSERHILAAGPESHDELVAEFIEEVGL